MEFAFVTIPVKDMEESIRFYHEILGLSITTRHPVGGGEMAMLGMKGQPNIELIYMPGSSETAYSGFTIGFGVDNLDTAAEELAAQGFPIIRGPISPAPGVRFSFVKDPNGVEVQLIQQDK